MDFIEPIYNANQTIEELAKGKIPRKIKELAKGKIPRERVSSRNPILSLHFGVDHLKLNYRGIQEGRHVFEGELSYAMGAFLNDGNFEVYDKYREALRKAGFYLE